MVDFAFARNMAAEKEAAGMDEKPKEEKSSPEECFTLESNILILSKSHYSWGVLLGAAVSSCSSYV